MEKYRIERNTVQETMVIPLYGRWLCSKRFPTLFADASAARLMEKIDYDFSELEKRSDSVVQVFGALETAMRPPVGDGVLNVPLLRSPPASLRSADPRPGVG